MGRSSTDARDDRMQGLASPEGARDVTGAAGEGGARAAGDARGACGTGGLSRRGFTAAAAIAAAMGVAAPFSSAGTALATGSAQVGGAESDHAFPEVTFSGDGLVLTRTDTGYRALTPYYSLDLPDSWLPGGFDATYDDLLQSLSRDGALLFGHTLSITLPPIDRPSIDNTLFVMCHSSDWSGAQGEFACVDVGVSQTDPSLLVSVYSAFDSSQDGSFDTAYQLATQYAALVNPGLAIAAAAAQAALSSDPYAYLSGLYARLDGFGNQVVGIANTFNSDFLADGLDRAYEQIQAIDQLQATLRAEYRNLLALQLVPGDYLYGQSCESLILVNDLQERLLPIRQAWTVRLRWPHDAESHMDAILAPLTQDLNADGVSLFKLDFEARYWRADPNLG